MGSGASSESCQGLGNEPARLMALVEAERREKQWLAQQYDLKCAEAIELQSQLEALQQLLRDPGGSRHAASPQTISRDCSVVHEDPNSPGGLSSPASSPSGRQSLRDRRGLRLSLETKPYAQHAAAAATSEQTTTSGTAEAKVEHVIEAPAPKAAPEAPPGRRQSLSVPSPSALAEARLRRNSVGSNADERLGSLSIEAEKQHNLNIPASPKKVLLSQKTWA